MTQRLRALQRGVALLGHQAGPLQSALPVCSGAKSLLQYISNDADRQQESGWSWQQHSWGGSSIGVRYASTGAAKGAAAASESDSFPSSSLDPAPEALPEFFPLPEADATEVSNAIFQACDALERASILGAKADAFFSASWCISGLHTVHEALGMPWWLSIAVFNITLRILTFPLMVAAQKGTAKTMEMNYDLLHAKKLQEAAMKAKSQEEHARLMKAFQQEYQAAMKKHDPMKHMLVVPGVMLLNGGIFLSIFNGISKLMAAKVPSLTVGGALWFTDLTVADPFYGLPIMCTLVTLAMVEYGINLAGDAGPGVPTDPRASAQRGMKMLMRALAFAFIPAGGYVAAGTAVLWVSNTTFGVFQGLMLRNAGFRARVGLPSMEALKEMNMRVMEANAAAAPTSAAPGASPLSVRARDPAPAAAPQLLRVNPVVGLGPGRK